METVHVRKVPSAAPRTLLARFDEIRVPGGKGAVKLLPDMSAPDLVPTAAFKTFDVRAAFRRGEKEPNVASLADFITIHNAAKSLSYTGTRETGPSKYVALVRDPSAPDTMTAHFVDELYVFTKDIALREMTPEEVKEAMEVHAARLARVRPAYVPRNAKASADAGEEDGDDARRREVAEAMTQSYR